jgi:hypothetical protein
VIRWQDPEARFFCPQRAHDASSLTTCTGHRHAQGAVPAAPSGLSAAVRRRACA